MTSDIAETAERDESSTGLHTEHVTLQPLLAKSHSHDKLRAKRVTLRHAAPSASNS